MNYVNDQMRKIIVRLIERADGEIALTAEELDAVSTGAQVELSIDPKSELLVLRVIYQ